MYEWLFKPHAIRKEINEVQFYKQFLTPCDLIFDIGGYDGHKTAALMHISSKVVCCEPDKKNLHLLQIRFRNERNRVAIEPYAIGEQQGTAIFLVHHPGSAFNTLSKKFKQIAENDQQKKWSEQLIYSKSETIPVITLDQLIDKYGKPNFIKIDVEGYELEVIKGLNISIPFISVECTFPEFEKEFYEIQELLAERFNRMEIKYNISFDEELQLISFCNRTELNDFLQKTKPAIFEIIIQMKPLF